MTSYAIYFTSYALLVLCKTSTKYFNLFTLKCSQWTMKTLLCLVMLCIYHHSSLVNILRTKLNCCHLADGILKWVFVIENIWILLQISLQFVPKVFTNNIIWTNDDWFTDQCMHHSVTVINVTCLHTMDLLWVKLNWIIPLYMKPINFQRKATVVCSVTEPCLLIFAWRN